ncbi:FG-GAP-like repeat-containing protein [Streptomyces hygroscopicus]|uniref:FG-GAP-like repeat-containing protein n=1 Tax=Streptomyces hygroscopicus TaxID=1912 RepID=UPI003632F912
MRSIVPVAAVTVSTVLLLAGCSRGGHRGHGERRPVVGAAKEAAGASLGDFNGDGYDDFATTIRPTSASRGPLPARLAVVYGSPRGLDPRHRLVVDGAEDDYVGPLLRADLDGDGYTDLVTARFRHGRTPGAERTGETVVLRGGRHGLSAPRPLGGGAAGFLALAVGDFDGDGAADLLASEAGGGGALRVLYGPFGTGTAPARTAPLPTGRERRAAPATATAGDFDGDHRTDVVLTYRYDADQPDQEGRPDQEGEPDQRDQPDQPEQQGGPDQPDQEGEPDQQGGPDQPDQEGEPEQQGGPEQPDRPGADDTAPLDLPVVHYRGSPKGLVRDKRPEPRLAHALGTEDGPREPAAGDADHDGIDDLLAPGEGTLGTGRHHGSGRLTVVHGARSGLGRGRADLTVDPSAPGLPGEPRRGDGFGGSPAVGDITGDGRPDLVVAVPETNHGNGRLVLLPGSRRGRGGEYDPAASAHVGDGGEQAVDLDTPGVPGHHAPYGSDGFAPQPPLLDVDGDGHDDVVAAAPGYGHGRTGGFWVLRGTGHGLSTRGVHHFTPADLGIRFRTG